MRVQFFKTILIQTTPKIVVPMLTSKCESLFSFGKANIFLIILLKRPTPMIFPILNGHRDRNFLLLYIKNQRKQVKEVKNIRQTGNQQKGDGNRHQGNQQKEESNRHQGNQQNKRRIVLNKVITQK